MPHHYDFGDAIRAAQAARQARMPSLTEKQIVNNDRSADRIDVELAAIERAKTALREAQERARIAALEAEYIEVRDRLHAANLAVAGGILALKPIGATLVDDGKRARKSAHQLGRAGRETDTLGPAQGHLEALLSSVVGSMYTGRVDSHAARSLAALKRQWRVTDAGVPDADATDHASDDVPAQADV